MPSNITGKNVLVTGAGGFIASNLCEQILLKKPAFLSCLNLTESGLYNLKRRLDKSLGKTVSTDTDIDYVIGSVTDSKLMSLVTKDIDLVIHAAAHKHVPICEENPCQAVFNNIDGTMSIVDACRDNFVPRFILISTDKAVEPESVMGATKKVAEMIVSEAGDGYNTVRFGNVLDSPGSVLPLWREQISLGQPVTITDPKCQRYFMKVEEACDLVLSVADMPPVIGTFIFDMGRPKELGEMLACLISEEQAASVEIEVIGLRSGDKLIEELHEGSIRKPTSHPKIFTVSPVVSNKEIITSVDRLVYYARFHDKDKTLHFLWDLILA